MTNTYLLCAFSLCIILFSGSVKCIDLKRLHICLRKVNTSQSSTLEKLFIAECCPNYYEYENACLECPAGTFGKNCAQICIAGHYGVACKKKCNCTNYTTCDYKKGCICKDGFTGADCRDRCPAGTHGENCSDTCRPNYYGIGCEYVCNCNNDTNCDPVKGCLINDSFTRTSFTDKGAKDILQDQSTHYVMIYIIGAATVLFLMILVIAMMKVKTIVLNVLKSLKREHEARVTTKGKNGDGSSTSTSTFVENHSNKVCKTSTCYKGNAIRPAVDVKENDYCGINDVIISV